MAKRLPSPPTGRRFWRAGALILVTLVAGGAAVWFRTGQPIGIGQPQYTALTNFADSATSPALSPDGRMLTFIRGPSTFFGMGQIYVKLLPDGEPVQLTHDDLLKFGPAFSPDGTRIAHATGMPGPERYSIAPDGQRAVFSAVDENGHTPVWLASLDGRTPPRKLTAMDCWDAFFGAPGEVLFECEEKVTPFRTADSSI